jgi:hypothetical protein
MTNEAAGAAMSACRRARGAAALMGCQAAVTARGARIIGHV